MSAVAPVSCVISSFNKRDHVLANLENLVTKPIDGYGGSGVLIGPDASEAELAALRDRDNVEREGGEGGEAAEHAGAEQEAPALAAARPRVATAPERRSRARMRASRPSMAKGLAM